MPTSRVRKKRKRVYSGKNPAVVAARSLDAARKIPSNLSRLESASRNSVKALGGKLGQLEKERRDVVIADDRLLPGVGWDGLHLVVATDAALCELGSPWPYVIHQNDGGDTETIWKNELRSNVDVYIEIMRLLRSARIYGAIACTRMFLERWTLNVAHSHGVQRRDEENDSEFITRAWGTYHWAPWAACMGQDWIWLSECIHGRGDLPAVLQGPYFNVNSTSTSQHYFDVANRVAKIATNVFRQVRAGVHHLLSEDMQDVYASVLQADPPTTGLSRSFEKYSATVNMPLDLATIFSFDAKAVLAKASDYRSSLENPLIRRELTKGIYPRLTVESVLERRGRAINRAKFGIHHERAFLGGKFNWEQMLSLLYRFNAVSSMAKLCADDSKGPESDALRTAAEALVAASELWLADDDLSLACLRGVLEQTARARTHRLKKDKAQKMEVRKSSPNRWVEAAGLRRLMEFSRALGEFSHVSVRSRRSGARGLLVEIQDEGEVPAKYTARKDALLNATYMLAFEVAERLDGKYPYLAEDFQVEIALLSKADHEKELSRWYDKALSMKRYDYGEPDYKFEF